MFKKLGQQVKNFKIKLDIENENINSTLKLSRYIKNISTILSNEINKGHLNKNFIALYNEILVIEEEFLENSVGLNNKYNKISTKYENTFQLLSEYWDIQSKYKISEVKIDSLYTWTLRFFFSLSKEMSNVGELHLDNKEISEIEDKVKIEIKKLDLENTVTEREEELRNLFKERRLRTYDEIRTAPHNKFFINTDIEGSSDIDALLKESEEIVRESNVFLEMLKNEMNEEVVSEERSRPSFLSRPLEEEISELQKSFNFNVDKKNKN